MFSSNQKFVVSCTEAQLPGVVELILSMHRLRSDGKEPERLAYQLTETGVLAIGRANEAVIKAWRNRPVDSPISWTPFDGITSLKALTNFIKYKIQTVRDNGYQPEPIAGDGSTKPGYIIERIEPSFLNKTEDGIFDPYLGIFTVKPYEVFYHQ